MAAFYMHDNDCGLYSAIKHFVFFALGRRNHNYGLRVAGKLFVVTVFFHFISFLRGWFGFPQK